MSAKKGEKRKHNSEENENPPNEPDEELHWSDDEGSIIDGIYIPAPITYQAAGTRTTRLVITEIRNSFFKSYGPNVVLGPFNKCFNAIIGPNGSGKSNVIDSMLFVFGYRANRIRCKKLSVLIHNSKTYSRVQSCTVAVHFCEIIDKPGDDYEVVPNSEFVVSRTANKDNSSYYELNGRRVQFKDVAKILRHHGIDLDHNRFLILQGEVEEISLMKSKGANEHETGMLEYLEDIIGTSRYKKPLAQLTDKIEGLSEIRTEKLNRLALIEKEVEQLKGPMEEAMNFLRSENRIIICKNFLYQRNIYDLQEQSKEIEEDKAKIIGNQDKIVEQLNELAKQRSEKEEILKQESSKYDKLNRKKEQMKEAFNAAEKKDVGLQAEQVQTNNNRKKNRQQLEDEKKKLVKLEKVPEENLNTIGECEAKLPQLLKNKEKLEKQKSEIVANIGVETADLQIKKEKLETELGKLKTEVAETKSAYDLIESQLRLAQTQETTEGEKLQKLQESLTNCVRSIKEKTQEASTLQKKIPPTEKSLNEALRDLEAVRAEKAAKMQEIDQQKETLQEQRSTMQMSKSRGRILDMLMQQKREGNCPGLYGRLGDLGAIDIKYDIAVSTACGPLDNIVVDTVETAKWCIEFLKKHGYGRATFIPLEKQEYLRQTANTKIKTPENVHRLFDLIKVQDETVRTAFYYGLRDTLVADDLDQATRIAYGAKRYRVVTLGGDLIEISGTMSGGGKTVCRGRMGQSVVTPTSQPQDLKRIEINLERNEAQLRQIVEREAHLQRQINALQPELLAMKANLNKLNNELQFLKGDQPVLQNQLAQQEKLVKNTKSDQKKIDALAAEAEAKKAKFDKASNAAEQIQAKVDELTELIAVKSTGKLTSVDKELKSVNKGIEKFKTEIARLKVASTAAERNATKCAQQIKTLEQNIAKAEDRLRELKAERETIAEDVQKLLQCIEEVTEQLCSGEEHLSGFKEEVAALTEEERKLLLRKVDIDQTVKTINKKLNDCHANIHSWTAKLTQLKLHDVGDEQSELQKYSAEELLRKNPEAVDLEMQAEQKNLKNAQPNLAVIEDFKKCQMVYMSKAQELEEISNKRTAMKNLFDKVKTQRRDEFMTGYNIIRLKLREMYQMITLGGDADFEILDLCDPFAEGVQLNIRPPRKSWKAISNLSGGEKTLSSLALVFALHHYKPSPLYVMDEIDAALDFKNVSIVGHYIKERTKNAQFIIISLRSNMFELCDNLVGIYKTFNSTKTITVDPRGYDENEHDVEKDQNKENENVNA